ncbi:hypothetical protein Bca4012_055882 [Brassica carinata]
MSDETKPASGDLASLLNGLDPKTRRVCEAARSLHLSAVKDLLSLGVCERCTFRLVTVAAFDSDFSSVSTSTLRSWLGSGDEEAASSEPSICIVCLGVLQFVFSDAKRTLVKSDCSSDYAAWITDLDALKVLVLDPLEASLGVKSDSSSFHIRLTYSKASDEAQDVVYADEENGSYCMSENPFEKVYEPCNLSVHCSKMPILFSGRYFKYSRNVSQSRWIIDDERMGEASVEEIIGGNILPACLGDSYKFHAAGREDIDVRMLGSGRPFLMEVQNSRKCPSQQSLTEIEEKINNSENKLVGVKDLKFIGSECWAMMREGEAEKQKQYAALVWISRPLEEKDCNSISSMKELKILQKTPIRVLHRRSPLERERTIHWMKVEKIKGNAHYFLLHLCTQAGTYIKEFVHGDLGRTTPSMGSILGCRAEIIQLDVTDVKMGDS